VIDLQGLTKSALVSLLARGPSFGLANRTEGASHEGPARWLATHAIRVEPHSHALDRSRELVAKALGIARRARRRSDSPRRRRRRSIRDASSSSTAPRAPTSSGRGELDRARPPPRRGAAAHRPAARDAKRRRGRRASPRRSATPPRSGRRWISAR
jgi:hypothetical protein